MTRRQPLRPLADRGPLRAMFLLTSMPVGGAETLLLNLVRRFDAQHVLPEIACLKLPGPLGEELAAEIPVHAGLLRHKYDWRVAGRLARLFRERRIDAVVTVGAGDKMFWGRIAAWKARVPVIAAALHSTGWPDGVGRLNRLLTPITDAFVGVAAAHGRHLVEGEGFPAGKVRVIPNGVDVERFRFLADRRAALRDQWKLMPDTPLVGILAALRPEKNHLLFLRAAAKIAHELPAARFVIVGDGPEREKIAAAAGGGELAGRVLMLGSRGDIPDVLSALDVLALTSRNEASPVSILEAMAVGLPVVATHVGSISESLLHGETGFLVPPGDADETARCWRRLLFDRTLARRMGDAGRRRVEEKYSLAGMVAGYERLFADVYNAKCPPSRSRPPSGAFTEAAAEIS